MLFFKEAFPMPLGTVATRIAMKSYRKILLLLCAPSARSFKS